MRKGDNLLLVFAMTSISGMAEPVYPLSAQDVIWKFSKGNGNYMRQSRKEGHRRKFSSSVMVDKIIEDPLKPVQRQAIIVSDARSFAAVDELFSSAEPGEIQAVRVSGCVIAPDDQFDGVLGSVEYALMQPEPPPLLMVMGNSKNEAVEDAVRLALAKPEGPWGDSPIVRAILPSAQDAIQQDPQAKFEDMCDLAAKLNVWKSIETMLLTSTIIHSAVTSGKLEVQGAFLDTDTGYVHFMGLHPANRAFLTDRPTFAHTAKDPIVPPEQALSMLYAGNKRYVKGNGISSLYDWSKANKKLTDSGQSPFAIVLGCADSRAPPEILFDARPGNIFVLRTAGNTLAAGQTSILGSAEYAVDHLRSKLIVVMGHTKCGAVTAAVEAVKAKADYRKVPGSIGSVLEDLHREAAAVVNRMPDAAISAQVAHAAELNVFSTIEKIIKSSEIIADGVKNMEVQVVGALYDIETGEVHWLGQHPKLEKIVGSKLPVHKWKYAPYVRSPHTQDSSVASEEIKQLKKGNRRFMSGKAAEDEPAEKPFAIVVAGSELRVPVEDIFDTSRGAILVQRSMGNIAGHRQNALLNSLEYAVQRFKPKLLLVLGASDSDVITSTLHHLDGQPSNFGPSHIVHEAVGASVLDAMMQTGADGDPQKVKTSAGRDIKRRGIAVEKNALYTVEQLFRHSNVIRDAVRLGKLEVHVGILQEDTGKVEFIGIHPMQEELLGDLNSHSLAEVESETVKPFRPVGRSLRGGNTRELVGDDVNSHLLAEVKSETVRPFRAVRRSLRGGARAHIET
mmetsp:Transcript_71004/g.135433  ORF Transcript_71004/g.135433 Transcript_71004/m.135433 type:complete len:789 (+) Transcript_71004:68-2434(+)